jgi:hypothetical protein
MNCQGPFHASLYVALGTKEPAATLPFFVKLPSIEYIEEMRVYKYTQ